VSRRRRRRVDGTDRRAAAERSSAKPKRSERQAVDQRAAFEAEQSKIKRRRTLFGLLGFVPLALSLGCGTGTPLDALCVIPRDVLLLAWAALFGSFLGLTIRLILERRKFERGTTGGPAT
jgi:hypothetical protein